MIRRSLLVIMLAACCTACGWQLRGTQTAKTSAQDRPEQLKLVFEDRQSMMATALKDAMVRLKMTLTGDAETVLIIEKEHVDKRPLAVTETGVTAQYQLMYSVSFHYENQKGEPLHTSRKVTSWRSYDFDAQLIVAKSQEEQSLLIEMREELAMRILNTNI